jgi:hypothetical protein
MDHCTCPIFLRLNNRNRAAKVNMQSASAIEFAAKPQGRGMDKKSFDMTGELRDILIENITAKNIELPVIIAGFRQKGKTKRIKNVTFKNIELEYRKAVEIKDKRLFTPEYSREYPECWRFRNLPAFALWARHAENIKLENFNCKNENNSWRKDIIFKDIIQ